MSLDQFLGQLRHLLSGAGAYFVAQGKIAQSDLEMTIGLVLFVAGPVWSWIDKHNRPPRRKKAEKLPTPPQS